jgi:hypothetical protein
VDFRPVRRRCELILRDVETPEPFEVDAFARVVSRRRGRRLQLIPKGTDLGPCGVWLALPEADYVFFEADTSGLHREHIILHELGHLLGDHQVSQVVDDRTLHALLPSLDLSMVRRVLGRTSYSAVEEQEAEMIASLVLERAGRTPRPRPRTGKPEMSAVLDKLESTLSGREDLRRD